MSGNGAGSDSGEGDDGGGQLADTYVAALQHDTADVPAGATLVGVVRRPTGWFRAAVDENHPSLGPPEAFLDDLKERQAALEREGRDEAAAHWAAWRELSGPETYREYLEESGAAREAVEDLLWRLDAGEDLALVCYENTENKPCHRTVLRAYLAERR